MKLYFDTEFTGLHKGTTLISLGIVAENGKKFYAEFMDYSQNQCNDWIKENVLKNTILGGNKFLATKLKEDSNTVVVLDSKENIRQNLSEWLKQFESVQFVSDVCHYDFVLLTDIFGTAFDLPNNVSAACHDINQDIAAYYNISEREAFNKSREEIISEFGIEIEGEKHNALYDAKVIRVIFERVKK